MTRIDPPCLGADSYPVAFVAMCCAGMLVAGAAGPPRNPGTAAAPRQVSGIYPHLAFFNDEAECGTGAVVPWANRLWAVTYAPHKPAGSSDKLYEIDDALSLVIRPESVGGTPANRFIHRESDQLLIGPYVIDAERNVRVLSPERLFGRLTGNARHLRDPSQWVYYATMEEGFYEVDVHTLAVRQLYADQQLPEGPRAGLPGYHGKGLYSGQGRLIYANNGEDSPEARRRPDIPSGCLAEWDGRDWRVVRRNQFTEVTGPGGLLGNPNPTTDPVWSIGWDHRSLILMLLDHGQWHAYRLPKASHCYDGAHGWNTEWPRIRDIHEPDLLMTMHGMFWRFPRDFTARQSAGITPCSTYLKVIGDFCFWQNRMVFGCDDTARNEFLNTRKAKGNIAPPGQSQSNLWFVEPQRLNHLGPPIGRGALWLEDDLEPGTTSDPFLFAGFDIRTLHLAHRSADPVTFSLEVDRRGDGGWTPLRTVTLPAHGYAWLEFPNSQRGAWIRIRNDRDCIQVTALFHYRNRDRRGSRPHRKFEGLAGPTHTTLSGGLVRARGENLRTLQFAALRSDAGLVSEAGYYEMNADLQLTRVHDPAAHRWLQNNVSIPTNVLIIDSASVLVVDDDGRRWRLPKGDPAFDRPGLLGPARVDREVCTERDLFSAHGTFYELPAENAGGFAKIRPIATHNLRIHDYASYRGLLVLTGITEPASVRSPHMVRSDDGAVSLWVGAVDDLWDLGKPRGYGGPWHHTPARSDQPSDPFLMTGYDRKTLELQHDSHRSVCVRVELDIAGTGLWQPWAAFTVPPGRRLRQRLPDALQAYWVRFLSDTDCHATALLHYD
jgi:hypothetical protein